MMVRSFGRLAALLVVSSLVLLVSTVPVAACGGFFCSTQPVDQVAERILFTVNDDDTVSSLIEITYQGEAADFSWVLPIPEAIGVNDIATPEDADLVFDELHTLTDMQFLPPRSQPRCAQQMFDQSTAEGAVASTAPSGAEVEVFASGEVGPFGFDVIGSDDPTALATWLRDNDYLVDESMEPLIDVYVQEEFAFLAMRLLPGEDAGAITPVELTYPGTQPMIPLRLTAVAAFPEMPIYAWILADEQAVPENYEHIQIDTAEITFFSFGGNDYTTLVQDRADAVNGQGFVTEFAGPASTLDMDHEYLVKQAKEQPYLTRLTTYIDPEEMTVDPMFGFDATRDDVTNTHDARSLNGTYDCERDAARAGRPGGLSDAIDPQYVNQMLTDGTFDGFDNLPGDAYEVSKNLANGDETAAGLTPNTASDDNGLSLGWLIIPVGVLGLIGIGYGAYQAGRNRPQN